MLNNTLKNTRSFVQLMRNMNNNFPDKKLRFVQNASLEFPQQEFAAVNHDDAQQHMTVLTNFLGLLGATGVMPTHYTEDLLHQLKAKNYAQKEFYDIFHQRIIELFYAADQALSPIIDADAINLNPSQHSAIQHYLCDLLGIDYQTNHVALQHNSFYANPTPSAAKLAQILRANTLLNITVQQSMPITENIPTQYCNQLNAEKSYNMLLNTDFVLGDRARFDHAYFLIVVTAECLNEFTRIKRDTRIMENIQHHARAYAGNAFKFNIEIQIDEREIQPMQLATSAYLGASSFL